MKIIFKDSKTQKLFKDTTLLLDEEQSQKFLVAIKAIFIQKNLGDGTDFTINKEDITLALAK